MAAWEAAGQMATWAAAEVRAKSVGVVWAAAGAAGPEKRAALAGGVGKAAGRALQQER